MTGALAMSNHNITSLAWPMTAHDAATKDYVDTVVQNALRDVGTCIPYAADVTNLPGSNLDAVHYSAAQQAELSSRFFDAWNHAKVSALAYPPSITDPILIVRQESSLFTNRWDAVRDEVTDTRDSRLHELWKYRRAHGSNK